MLNKARKGLLLKKKKKKYRYFLPKYVCYWYSLKVPSLGTSNEYPQHTFHVKIKSSVYPIPTYSLLCHLHHLNRAACYPLTETVDTAEYIVKQGMP